MDVTRRYYEGIDDFVRALGRNSHRRRHLPFWNLALGALVSSEAAAEHASSSPALALLTGGTLASATSGIVQSAISDSTEPIGVFSRAMSASTTRVLYVTFHASSTSHVAPMSYLSSNTSNNSEDVLVASAVLTNSLIVLFCADDTLDALVASWVYAEILNTIRGRSNAPAPSTAIPPPTAKIPPSSSTDKLAPKSFPYPPSSLKPMRFSNRVSLYGSMAHVRALLDLASSVARDPKFQIGGSFEAPRRYIPPDYRMSRDDSGMRVLGGRQYRASIRPQTCEFAFGPSVFKRRTRNAYRMFFIATERLEAIDKAYAEAATRALIGESSESTDSNNKKQVPIHDTSKLIMDAAKCLRMATSDDWEELKAILKRENPYDETTGEDEDSEFDNVLESVQKGNIYIWESAKPSPKTGKLGKPKIRCFAVLEFHTRRLPELSCVEIVDLHLSNPNRDNDTARMLTESLSRKFLTTTATAPAPYHFLFVKVDVSVPATSDQFLLDCGFVADSVADFVTLDIVQTRDRSLQLKPTDPFEITRVVRMSPLTEKPFSAYEIRVTETNELVRKRYREFDKLYFQLKAQLPGTNIPKLPKKKFFGNMDESFVEKRRVQLQTWLNTVARLPGVEESGWVSNFLWTDLKIRGVKPVSEAEKFQRTLQRQAEEAKQSVLIAAQHATQSSPALAWPATATSTPRKDSTDTVAFSAPYHSSTTSSTSITSTPQPSSIPVSSSSSSSISSNNNSNHNNNNTTTNSNNKPESTSSATSSSSSSSTAIATATLANNNNTNANNQSTSTQRPKQGRERRGARRLSQ